MSSTKDITGRSRAAEFDSPRRRLQQNVGTMGPVFAFLLLLVFFSVLRPDVFLSQGNIMSIANNQAVLGIAACGLTVVLLAGEFDLSIGSTMSLTGTLGAGLVANQHWSPLMAVLAALAIGLLIGIVNGVLVAFFGVQALIATLAVSSLLDGVSLWYTGGRTIFSGISPHYVEISRWNIGGLQGPVFYLVVLGVLLWLWLRHTQSGRYIHAIGGNRDASRMTGIRVNRYVVIAFAVSGACAAAAGVLQTAHDGAATPLFGSSFLLPAFAAAFLGSATLRRGEFHIPGTIFGVYLIAIGSTGFVLLGAPFYTQQLFSGAVLIVATARTKVFRGARRHRRPQVGVDNANGFPRQPEDAATQSETVVGAKTHDP